MKSASEKSLAEALPLPEQKAESPENSQNEVSDADVLIFTKKVIKQINTETARLQKNIDTNRIGLRETAAKSGLSKTEIETTEQEAAIELTAITKAAQNLTDETIEKIRQETMGIEATDIDLDAIRPKEILEILQAENFSIKTLIASFKKTPEFTKLLEADAGVGDKISIETHIERVSGQFEKFLASRQLPPGIDKAFMQMAFLLHDIGKPLAIEKGDKQSQHQETTPIMRAVLKKLGYDQAKTDLMVALVDGDPIGEVVRKKTTVKEAAKEVEKMARQANLPVDLFFQLLETFYLADASSYTSEAGGKGSLDKIFVFDKEKGRVDLSIKPKELVQQLKSQLEQNKKAREAGMVSEEEISFFSEKNKEAVDAAAADLLGMAPEIRDKKFLEMVLDDKVQAIAIAERLNSLLGEKTNGTNRESNLTNIDRYRKDEKAIQQAILRIQKNRQVKDIDAQYALMTMFYNENPALYVAAMERLTYSLDTAVSREHRDAKIGRLLENYTSPEEIISLNRLQRRLEAEVVPGLLDTHGTDLNAIFGMILEGGIDTPHRRKQKGRGAKGTAGDDIKLAGSLSVFSYLGSFWEVQAKNVLITFDRQFLEEKTPNDSYYTTEDFVLKPTKDLDLEKAGLRMSFDEKLNDVMKRQDMKRYLSFKMADHIFQQAKSKDVPIDEIPSVDLANGIISFLRANSDITRLPQSKLGGRPEGHLHFEIPITAMTIRVPREPIADLMAGIQKHKAVFDARLEGKKPKEVFDPYECREYEMLASLASKFEKALEANPNITMRDLLLSHIAETIKELEKTVSEDQNNGEVLTILERLKNFNSNSIIEYDKGGLNSNHDYKRKEYLEQVLDIKLSNQVAMEAYRNVDFVRSEGSTRVHSAEPMFIELFADYLTAEKNIAAKQIKKKGNVLIVSGDADIIQMAREFMPLYLKKSKEVKVKGPERPKEQIVVDPKIIPEVLRLLRLDLKNKDDIQKVKQDLMTQGLDALTNIKEKYGLSEISEIALKKLIIENPVLKGIEKKAA